MMRTIKVLGLCGSLRKQSTNKSLLHYAQNHAPEGISIEIADLTAIPFFNADIADKPESVELLCKQMENADAFLFACPEYNYSIAPALKNALDWASREADNYLLANKTAALLGSGGGMGTSRAQYHLRQVCVYLNLHLLNKPEIFCNAFTGAFNAEGELVDTRIQELIIHQLNGLRQLTIKLAD
jgi:chromate reductase